MVLLDVGQVFRCAGQHFMCVATGTPIKGGPYRSVTVAHTPETPPPLLSTPSPKQRAPDKESNKSELSTVEH